VGLEDTFVLFTENPRVPRQPGARSRPRHSKPACTSSFSAVQNLVERAVGRDRTAFGANGPALSSPGRAVGRARQDGPSGFVTGRPSAAPTRHRAVSAATTASRDSCRCTQSIQSAEPEIVAVLARSSLFSTTCNLTTSLTPAPVISPKNPVTTMLLNRINNLA